MSPKRSAGDALEVDALPQRGRMRVVESGTYIDEHHIQVEATVSPRWPTVEQGSAKAVVLVELIAQGAALLGMQLGHHAPDSLTLLVGLPEVVLYVPRVDVGTHVVADIKADRGIWDYLVCRGEARDGDRLLASVVVQGIRLPPDIPPPWAKANDQ